jgi:hypothetical protein
MGWRCVTPGEEKEDVDGAGPERTGDFIAQSVDVALMEKK